MKVIKVVPYTEVERHTMDGWELDKVLTRSHAATIPCSTPLVPHACSNGGYSSGTQYSTRDEAIQVHEPLFVLTKDLDTLKKELLLAEEIKKYVLEKADLQKQNDQWKLTAERLQQEVLMSQESAKIAREHRDEKIALARKLEGDVGKIRQAIGDLRMKEILNA
jgi:hypothetical protein